ncbi:MAG TPA: YIP1 family protein [Candidatus Angelobacter sp.]
MSTPSSSPMPLEQTPELSQPALSEPARIINTFVAPSKTFMDIRRNASWWVPWLLGTVIFMGFMYTVEKKIGWEAVVNYQMSHASFMQRLTAQMPPEQKQIFMDKQIAGAHRRIYTTPIVGLIFYLIFAALLMATFNFGFGSKIKFKTALAVLSYGWLPRIVTAIVSMIVLAVGVEPEGFDMENPITTHLGVLLGSNTDSRYLYHVLSGIDIISIWWVCLVGLGFAIVSERKISKGAAITAVAAWYVVGTLLRVAITPFGG